MTVEINGAPAAKVTVRVSDLINTGNYQNVTIVAEVERYVEDTPDAIDAELRNLAHQHCEPFLAEEREKILTELST